MNQKQEFFKELNTYFDKIYVVSLSRSTHRQNYIKQMLNGLDFDFFWGVDGKTLNLDELEKKDIYNRYQTKLFKKRKGLEPRNLSLTRIGCALSHISIYNDIIDNQVNRALILEDDVEIDLNSVHIFKKGLQEIPDNWHLLYLGHKGANSNPSLLLRFQKFILSILARGFQKFERVRMINPQVIDGWFPRHFSNNLDISGAHHGTYAYAVSLEGARTLLKYQIPIVQEIDNTIAELCNYRWIHAYNLKKNVFYPNLEIPSVINS